MSNRQTCWIIGGGCYGSGYLRQLRKARQAGKSTGTQWIVLDRNVNCRATSEYEEGDPLTFRIGEWAELLFQAMAKGEFTSDDLLIPGCYQGRLFIDWLTKEAQSAGRKLEPLALEPVGKGLRFEQSAPNGFERYLSFAGWRCPVHCIEPAKCPKTRDTKSWDIRDTVADYANVNGFTVLPLACLHWVYGVGAIEGAAVLAARRHVREGLPGRVLMASTSTCHGLISGWELKAASVWEL